MYKALIVDDEEIERNGMVNLIPWEEQGIEIVGDAWNGFEGYQMVKEMEPDIVITDIKMPGMDGIELIAKVQKDYPDTFFIVLSGYGEYEYTSRAMELGVKYYILKPCDETKILKVVNQVKLEIQEKKKCKRYEDKKYNEEIKKLLPRAREQFFNKVLSGVIVSNREFQIYQGNNEADNKVCILNCRIDGEIDDLGKFVLQNITEEFITLEKVVMSTYIDNEVVFMLKDVNITFIRSVIQKLRIEYKNYCKKQISAALSDTDEFINMKELYDQTRERLFFDSYGSTHGLATAESLRKAGEENLRLLDFDKFKQVDDYVTLLYETNILFAKLTLEHYNTDEIKNVVVTLLNNLLKEEIQELQIQVQDKRSKRELYKYLIDKIVRNKPLILGYTHNGSRDNNRIQEILFEIYSNLDQRNLSLQWLAKDILFLNEEYFGRLFQRTMNKKFSTFVFEIRIEMAKRLIQFKPELLISELAELVGYTADGQYFSKVFKKYTNVTPSEYKEMVMK
ncbi:two-component system response regulator YesN [Lachnotalea glycerini]|uniref:Stage 0 sporulation protein A homolog n=1 Tax=Lachnotalea glycerini TaxID=1763509 RepID=A0A255HZ91_9FIRM|nr:response regulator [Lachnotalea glycerini]PXV87310.1 two-component system response regulator YesN [Lachnotalea glycerini]RDY30478.1 response regulator [Lachnotalea glycerini]